MGFTAALKGGLSLIAVFEVSSGRFNSCVHTHLVHIPDQCLLQFDYVEHPAVISYSFLINTHTHTHTHTGNPTIIPNTPNLNLRGGFHTDRPSLGALASSNPPPNRTMWLFQDQELVNGANGIIVSIINNMGELLFPQNIDSSIAGDYVFRMESGAGIVSVTLAVIVESRFEG